MTRVLLAALGLLAIAPAVSARTIHEDLDAAHAYWNSTVCQGQWQVTPDTRDQRGVRNGAATGIAFTWNGTGWDWHIDRCEFTMNPQLEGCDRAAVIRHEVGHFIHGPSHTGPMAPHAVDRAACPIKPKASKRLRAKSARLNTWRARR